LRIMRPPFLSLLPWHMYPSYSRKCQRDRSHAGRRESETRREGPPQVSPSYTTWQPWRMLLLRKTQAVFRDRESSCLRPHCFHGVARALGLHSVGITFDEGSPAGIAFGEARSAGNAFGEARQTRFRQNRPRQTKNRQNFPRQTGFRQEPPSPDAKASENLVAGPGKPLFLLSS
jgi:hypothetical protein